MNLVQAAPLNSGTVRTKSKAPLIYNKKSGKYSSISMLLNKSKSSQTPERLNRELQRIGPRIKLLENDACLLRNLVPFGFKDMIDQANNDLLSLQKKYSNEDQCNETNNNDIEKNDSEFDLDEKLNEVKQRIFTRLDCSIESLLKMIKDEKENIEKQEIEISKKLKPVNIGIINFEEDYLEEIQQRIESTTEIMNEKHCRIKDRINSIQKSAQKLCNEYSINSNDNNESTVQKLKNIEEDCKIHKDEIINIKAKIDEIQQNLSHNIKQQMSRKVLYQNESIDNTIGKNITSNLTSIPSDLSNQIEELKQEADSFKIEFQNSLIELKKEAFECENESQELTKKIASISTSTEAIEANANSANKLVHELQNKINKLSSKMEQKECKDSLISIIDQIKSTNEQIAKDIKDIKSKINLPDIPKSEVDTNDNEI